MPVFSADLDGDSDRDPAVGNWFSDNVSILLNLSIVPTTCCNGDRIRGNIDDLIGPAGEVDVADLTYLVGYLFQGGPAPAACP